MTTLLKRLCLSACFFVCALPFSHAIAETPNALTPASNATLSQDEVISYSWDAVANATGYDLLIYDRTQSSIIFRDMSLNPADICSANVCTVTPDNAVLPVGNRHYWRVASITDTGKSSFSYTLFSVIDSEGEVQPPAEPVALSPSAFQDIAEGTSIIYTWESAEGATTYDFLLYDRTLSDVLYRDRTLSAAELCDTNTNVCSFAAPNDAQLPISDSHVWRVAAINSAGKSSFSRTVFNVISAADPPLIPTPVSPAEASDYPENDLITFVWDADTNVTSYDFILIDRSGPGVIHRNTALLASTACSADTCQYTAPSSDSLPVFSNHVWRVAGINNAGKSAFTFTKFNVVTTAEPPGTPLPVFPSTDESIAVDNPITYSWQAVEGATDYDFLIIDRSTGLIQFRNSSISAATICTDGLCEFTPDSTALPIANKHKWRVAGINNAGKSGFSNTLFNIVDGTISGGSPELSSYTLVFNEEFNGNSLDPAKWNTGLLWGPYLPINNEKQLYVDTLGINEGYSYDPFSFTGESLVITATATSDSLQPPPRPDENDSVWNNFAEYRYNGPVTTTLEDGTTTFDPGYQESDVEYLSGIITSYDSFKMTHGYVEARVKLPAGAGLWPAFWMLTTHYVEDVPEIDVMEFLGQNTDKVYQTYHYFDIENNWAKISSPTFEVDNADWTADFHTFGMSWSLNEIVWYIDGVETHRITDSDYTIAGQAMYLLANLAVGGDWPGNPDDPSDFPAEYEIDYIRAYKKNVEEPINLAEDFELVFNDEFNENTLDEAKWNTAYLWGPYRNINNEKQYYVDANDTDSDLPYSPFTLNNGVLSITADLATNSPASVPPATLPDDNDPIWSDHLEFQKGPYPYPGSTTVPDYTSGVITSYDAFKFTHGYAEIRARAPAVDGLWPAFWLLNAYYIGDIPEIDILEGLGETPGLVYHTYHYYDDAGQLVSTQFTSTVDTTEFHTYGVHWQHGKLVFYIDGVPVHTLVDEKVAYQNMYVIANMAVGGNFTSAAIDDSKLPATFDIDYIRVYQENLPD